MDTRLIKLMETAIKIKIAFSIEEIRLEVYEDCATAIVTTGAVNNLQKLYELTKGYEPRLIPVDNKIEIRLTIVYD